MTARQTRRSAPRSALSPRGAWTPIPSWLSSPGSVWCGRRGDHLYSVSRQGRDESDSWCAGSVPRPGPSWRCSRPGTTTRSSTTAPATWWRSRPTTAGTRSSSSGSQSSNPRASRTCRRQVHGQRRLARAHRNGPQPRTRRRCPRWTRPRESDRRDSATAGLHRPGTTGHQRPTPTLATTPEPGPGPQRSSRHSPQSKRSRSAPLLTTNPIPPGGWKPADRRYRHAFDSRPPIPATHARTKTSTPSHTVDPVSGRLQHR